MADMVAPLAVDLEIGGGEADLPEAAAAQQLAAGRIVGDAGCVDAMKAQPRVLVIRRGESERQQYLECRAHQAVAGKGLAHPITEVAALCRKPSDIVEIDAAQQRVAGQ